MCCFFCFSFTIEFCYLPAVQKVSRGRSLPSESALSRGTILIHRHFSSLHAFLSLHLLFFSPPRYLFLFLSPLPVHCISGFRQALHTISKLFPSPSSVSPQNVPLHLSTTLPSTSIRSIQRFFTPLHLSISSYNSLLSKPHQLFPLSALITRQPNKILLSISPLLVTFPPPFRAPTSPRSNYVSQFPSGER